MEALIKDLRVAVRLLLKEPWTTMAIVLSLAWGIGFIVTVFAAGNAILWRPLPVEEPAKLVSLRSTSGQHSSELFSYPDFDYFREKSTSFDELCANLGLIVSVGGGAETQRVYAKLVSPEFFSVLRAPLQAGRTFLASEGEAAVVISHGFWARRLGGRANALGSRIMINRHEFTIVGITSNEYYGVEFGITPVLWMPQSAARLVLPQDNYDALSKRDAPLINIWGRIKDGVDLQSMNLELTVISRQLKNYFPSRLRSDNWQAVAVPLSRTEGFESIKIALLLLMTLACVVLLGTCSNIENLLLARASGRSNEMVVRRALGATSYRVVRQLLTEGLLLACTSGVLGFVAVYASRRALSALPTTLPVPLNLDLHVDSTVVSFAVVVSLGSVVVFALAPALRAAKPNLASFLRQGVTSTEPRETRRIRDTILLSQIALSLFTLVVAASILYRLSSTLDVDLGFQANGVVSLSIDQGADPASASANLDALDEMLDRIRRLPEISDATAAAHIPLWSEPGLSAGQVFRSSQPPAQRRDATLAYLATVSDLYFETLKIPLMAGRGFVRSDRSGAPRVAVVSESLASRLWKDESPLGEQLSLWGLDPGFGLLGSNDSVLEIVGVAGNAKHLLLDQQLRHYVYVPFRQNYREVVSIQARSRSERSTPLREIELVVTRQNARHPVFNRLILSDVVSLAMWPQRGLGMLVAALGLWSVSLSALGLFGVARHSGNRRLREFAIRTALGASQSHILKLALRDSSPVVMLGLLAGVILSAVVLSLVSSFVGISASLPVFAWVVPLLLVLLVAFAALIGGWRRVLRMNPVDALRHE